MTDDSNKLEFINNDKELCHVLHHAITHNKYHCLCTIGNTKLLMSCTKVDFVPHQKILIFLYNSVLEAFYVGASAQKDLTRIKEFISSVEHMVDDKKASIVEMKMLQFNYVLLLGYNTPHTRRTHHCHPISMSPPWFLSTGTKQNLVATSTRR